MQDVDARPPTRSWGHVGKPAGSLLEAFGESLGASWDLLGGPFGVLLDRAWAVLRPSWGPLGPSRGPPVALLGLPGVSFRNLWGWRLLGVSWGFWVLLGVAGNVSWGQLGGLLGVMLNCRKWKKENDEIIDFPIVFFNDFGLRRAFSGGSWSPLRASWGPLGGVVGAS